MIRNFTKIIIKNNIRIYLSDLTDTINEILYIHKYLPLPSLILANSLATFTPLKFLYDTNRMMVQIKSNGAIKNLILETNNDCVRSLIANPNIETEYDIKKYNSIPIILGIGDSGNLEISREVNNKFFRSETQLVRFDIVTDLAYFLNKSDQIFSAVLTDVELSENDHTRAVKAKNIIFQLLPNHTEEDKIWIEEFISKHKFKELSVLEIEKLIDGNVLSIKQIYSDCWCNKNKIIDAINLLSFNEKNEIFDANNQIEVVCEFCRMKHIIKKEEISNE